MVSNASRGNTQGCQLQLVGFLAHASDHVLLGQDAFVAQKICCEATNNGLAGRQLVEQNHNDSVMADQQG